MNPTAVIIKRNIIYVFNAIIFRQKYVIERIFLSKGTVCQTKHGIKNIII